MAEIRSSIDDPIRTQKDGSRDRNAECPGSSCVDNKFERGGLFHRDVSRLDALEHFVDDKRGAPVLVI